jgi:uncharacterized protein (TIGR02598 family)
MCKHSGLSSAKLKPAQAGFSLVEIVFALGIVAVTFTVMMGLLTVGLRSSQAAINTSVTTQIAQLVIDDAQQTDFAQLTHGNAINDLPVRYFDYTGTELASSGNTVPSGAIYQALVRVQAPISLPGSAVANATLAQLTVQVATDPSYQILVPDSVTYLWPVTNPGIPIATYSTQVAGSNQQL